MARFDLNLLGALQALLTERKVTPPGDRLHVTQPTMSGMLQRLRHQFGDELLVRVGRNMELTPLAQSLIEPVRDALRGIEALAKAEPTFTAATSARTFSMMMSDYCTLTFLPSVVRTLAISAPGIRLDVRPMCSPVERVLSGEVDMCIGTEDFSLLNHEGEENLLHSQLLFSDEFVCLVAEDHPLNDPITMQDYLLYSHVGVQLEGVVNTIVSAAFRQHAPLYRPSYTVPEFMAIPYMVAGSHLIGVVQKRLALSACEVLPLRMFSAPFHIPNINETLLWHPRHTADPAHTWFRNMLTHVAADGVNVTKCSRRALQREKASLASVA